MGARPLRRAIQRYIEDPLADFVLGSDLKPGVTIVVDRKADDDEEVSITLCRRLASARRSTVPAAPDETHPKTTWDDAPDASSSRGGSAGVDVEARRHRPRQDVRAAGCAPAAARLDPRASIRASPIVVVDDSADALAAGARVDHALRPRAVQLARRRRGPQPRARRTSRRRTCSSATTTWSSSAARISAGCSARLETTSFDVVSCVWLDFDPWRGICRGLRRFEGTLDIEDGVLVHRLGATRGRRRPAGLRRRPPVLRRVALERLGPAPWDAELNLSEHYELFLTLKERGLRCTRLPDVVVQHRQELPPGVSGGARGHRRYVAVWLAKRGLRGAVAGGRALPRERRRALPPSRHGRLRRPPRVARRHPAASGRKRLALRARRLAGGAARGRAPARRERALAGGSHSSPRRTQQSEPA